MAGKFAGGTVKIHFANAEQVYTTAPAKALAGVRFALGSAYPFVCRSLGLTSVPIFSTPPGADPRGDFLAHLAGLEHGIVDSGLFTMLFGAGASDGRYTEAMLLSYTDALIDFYSAPEVASGVCAAVEVDCQGILSADFAWQLRRHMRSKLPQADILNVWHAVDGRDGLDRMIDFSDYLALSLSELQRTSPAREVPEITLRLVEYILSRRADLRIHLLGCTDLTILKRVNGLIFSSDSASWTNPTRYPGPRSVVGWTPEAEDYAALLRAFPDSTTWPAGRRATVLKFAAAAHMAREKYHRALGRECC